ncbi:MAG: universal stress protein [Candidatus Binatia bacterium]
METVRKILAPTDLSELSCVGLRHALETGRSRGVEVIVYYVIELGDQWIRRREVTGPIHEMIGRHKRMLDSFLRDKFPDLMNLVEVQQVVELGAAAHNIVEKAKSEGVDMIVMSTHGRTGFNHLILGSVSEKVVARAPCPVLVIPAHKRDIAKAA